MPTVLITVDSLRPDHLGQYGYERETMPVLDELTADGTVFTNAFANGPYTRVSIPSFHTSRYLSYGDLTSFPTIPSMLESAGVRTAAIGTQTGLGHVKGDFRYGEMIDLGRDEYGRDEPGTLPRRAFDRIDDAASTVSLWLQYNRLDPVYNLVKRPYNAVLGVKRPYRHKGYTSAEVVTDRAIEWLDGQDDADFFLWLHYMEAHRPYGIHDREPAYLDGPVEPSRINDLMKAAGTDPASVSESDRRLMIDLYDSDIRYCSRHLSRLFDSLRSLELWDDSNIILSADHGEEFGEHGLFFHRNFPYDELIHVPLVVRTGSGSAPATIAEQRELLDLAPTICSFHDVDVSEYGLLGTPLFEGEERTVIALGQPGMDVPAAAVRANGWKYIHTDETTQLYDLGSDPGERHNVADANPAVESKMKRKIPTRLFGRHTRAPRPPADEVDREQLEALGYMELRESAERE